MKAGENLAGIHSTPLISIFTFFVQMPQPVFLSSLSINAMCTTKRELSVQSTVRAGLCRYVYVLPTNAGYEFAIALFTLNPCVCGDCTCGRTVRIARFCSRQTSLRFCTRSCCDTTYLIR